jgi:hypothetical protein
MERLDRANWKQYQNLMQDSTKFVEMLHEVNLDEGLSPEVYQGASIFTLVFFFKFNSS